MSEPIRVLHIVGAMYPGGYENFIMNLYENIDREKLQFDMVVHGRKPNDYVEKIQSMGGRVYELPRLTKKPVKSLKMLYELVRKNQYKAVIRHTPNALTVPQLWAAKKAGAFTICHSHNETDPKKFLHKVGKLWIPFSVDDRFACSEKAGIWMFGKKDYRVIHNAIDLNKFSYSPSKADQVKEEFGLQGKHIYGHIANFIASKNHMFLLEIYKKIAELDPKAVFFCLGEGDLRPEIEAKRKELQLEDRVILTGTRFDAENFMSAFGVLIFPSFFEGLPLTLIEAQAAGLQCLISDTITKDVVVSSDLIHAKSLEEDAESWARAAVALYQNPPVGRECQKESIRKAGYDVQELAEWFTEYMMNL